MGAPRWRAIGVAPRDVRAPVARRAQPPSVRRARRSACGCSVHEGGVHATLAGVVLGLLAPTRPFRQPDMVDADAARRRVDGARRRRRRSSRARVGVGRRVARVPAPPVEQLRDRSGLRARERGRRDQLRLDRRRGVVLTGDARDRRGTRRRQAGGHQRVRLARVPPRRRPRCPTARGSPTVVGIAALGGIGFTVSLFVSELAFGAASPIADDAKLGILAASLAATALGAVLLLTIGRSGRDATPGPPKRARNSTRIVA